MFTERWEEKIDKYMEGGKHSRIVHKALVPMGTNHSQPVGGHHMTQALKLFVRKLLYY